MRILLPIPGCKTNLTLLSESHYGIYVSLEVPPDRRKRRTYNAILDAADGLFTRNSYHGTTIEELANTADVAVSSIYSHFSAGKADVYAALAWRIVQRHVEAMSAALDRAVADHGYAGAVAAAFDEYVAFHQTHPLALRMLSLYDVDSAASEQVAKARTQIEAALDKTVNEIAGAVRRAGCDCDAMALTLQAWASVNGAVSLRQRLLVDDRTLSRMLTITRTDLLTHLGGDR